MLTDEAAFDLEEGTVEEVEMAWLICLPMMNSNNWRICYLKNVQNRQRTLESTTERPLSMTSRGS
jgi:hypothetical protein